MASPSLRRPGLDAAALTLLLGSVLLVGGVARIVGGIGERHESHGWIIVNRMITLLLGLLIVGGWPGRPCGCWASSSAST